MSRDFDLIAKNSNLAEITEEFRNAMKEFVESAKDQVSVMNSAFQKNGMAGNDDLVAANRDALMNNVKEISMDINRLDELEKKLYETQLAYEKLVRDLWNGIQ